jgi:hypothetical protein
VEPFSCISFVYGRKKRRQSKDPARATIANVKREMRNHDWRSQSATIRGPKSCWPPDGPLV